MGEENEKEEGVKCPWTKEARRGDAIEYSSEPPKRPERPFAAFLASHAYQRTTNER